ncbi:hypothetical protein [Rhizosphaericola mali]|uniref:Uncharacterized protein n=1 Tax=Rhizosphaericola mali TaxID=2545455 RepID=A0A5P2G576_9BACT|nr:hypothetical protein [Rhizosphaericola mali]QES88972.1 hypothetical protein E0W69_009990 [Rhizosphaericola mali]
MKTKQLAEKKYVEALHSINIFLQRLKSLDETANCDVIKAFNLELEHFLDSYHGNKPDGFLESIKQYNRTGTWCNPSYLLRVLMHFKRKWSQNTMVHIL